MKKTIKIFPKTHQRLLQEGKKAESFDDIINRLLKEYNDEKNNNIQSFKYNK